MKSNGMRTTLTCMAVLLSIAASGCAPSPTGPEATPTSISLFGFTAASTTQFRVDAVAEAVRLEHPDWTVSSMAAGGEARLMEKRLAGEADFFFPPAPWAIEQPAVGPLHAGVDFEEDAGYRVVVPSASLFVHFLAVSKTGLETPGDIVAQRYPFAMGGGAGVGRYVLDRILAYYGTDMAEAEAWGSSYEVLYMSSPEGVTALQSGRLDTGFTWLGIPGPHFLGVTFDLRLLKFTDQGLVAEMGKLGLLEGAIPADTYSFLSEEVPTVRALQPLVARTGLPDDVVYEVVKAVFAHRDIIETADPGASQTLTASSIAEAVNLSEQVAPAFHPGALRYYRESGWIS
jgi:TRAP transporter TAXI family solute receptor